MLSLAFACPPPWYYATPPLPEQNELQRKPRGVAEQYLRVVPACDSKIKHSDILHVTKRATSPGSEPLTPHCRTTANLRRRPIYHLFKQPWWEACEADGLVGVVGWDFH